MLLREFLLPSKSIFCYAIDIFSEFLGKINKKIGDEARWRI